MKQVCGLDVHKDSVFVCILNENGVVFKEKYGVLTPELEQMLAKMLEYHVEEVCMESTSIYWMPVWRVLENYVSLKLVNPYFIKQLPGKKSDVKDAGGLPPAFSRTSSREVTCRMTLSSSCASTTDASPT